MRNVVSRAFALWIPLIVVLTGVFAFAYLAVQQNYRQSVNDPQIQMAEDIAARMAGGDSMSNFIPGEPPIDIRASLGTWVTLYDASGTPLESSAVLDGTPP